MKKRALNFSQFIKESSGQGVPSYVTKSNWTLKTTKNTFRDTWEVVLNIPAGTVWKQIKEPHRDDSYVYKGAVMETETAIGYKFILLNDPSVSKYSESVVRAAIYHEGYDLGREVHILIPMKEDGSQLPAGYEKEMTGGLMGARRAFTPVEFDEDGNPHAKDLFYNLYEAFTEE